MKTKAFMMIALLCLSFGGWGAGAWAQTEVSSESALTTALSGTSPINITLTASIELSNYLGIEKEKTVTIDLNGKTLSRSLSKADSDGHVIWVKSGGTLTIKDSSSGSGKLRGGWANNGGGICNYGTLYFQGGTITDCKGKETGGGIRNNGTATISGGVISNCWGDDGGGVYNNGGCTLTISGGTITGNTSGSHAGGGVLNKGTATISGGTITGNSCKTNGGGIWSGSASTLTVTGGTISGNTANGNGGGIYLDPGTLKMSGNPKITGNTADDITNNVYLISSSVINVTGAFTEGADIGVTLHNYGRKFTSGYSTQNGSTAPGNYFTADLGGSTLSLEGGEAKLSASGISYIERRWTGGDTDGRVVGETKICTDYRPLYVQSESDGVSVWVSQGVQSGKWNYINRDFTYTERIVISSNTSFILGDGVTLTCEKGIHINDGCTLSIYGQSGDSGKLRCTGDGGSTSNGDAAIGGNNEVVGGYLVIHGGNIYAEPSHNCAAGIGGGDGNSGMRGITIYGGTVEAKGSDSGAGIGGGEHNDVATPVTIYGGTITAKGGNYGAGIGGGEDRTNATIKIYGGDVTAKSYYDSGFLPPSGGGGAGIGAGEDGNQDNPIYIYGGTVYAEGAGDGAGIGGGDDGNGGYVYIYGGTVTAEGNGDGKAIGGGDDCNSNGTVTLADNIEVRGGGTDGGHVETANRESYLQTKGTRTAMVCSHESYTYEDLGLYYHQFKCAYCKGYKEAHIRGNDDKCTKCGRAVPQHTMTFYEANSDGSAYSYPGTVFYATEESPFTLPECSSVPAYTAFAGWLEADEAPETLIVDDATGLLPAGSTVTLGFYSHGLRYYARYTSTWGLSGSGAEGDPYIIATTDDLNELALKVNQGHDLEGKYVKLTADLDFAPGGSSVGDYTPIGKGNHGFKGTFDGEGHSISGINISGVGNSQGLFGYIASGGTVKNLTVKNSTIAGNTQLGGIAGENYGTISNCHVADNVTINITSKNAQHHAGIAGYNKGLVEGCTSAVRITLDNSSIENYTNGDFDGGIVGYNYGTGVIKYCLYLGSEIYGKKATGAIVGIQESSEGSLVSNYYVPQEGLKKAIGEYSSSGDHDEAGKAEKGYTVSSGTAGLTLDFGVATKAFDYDGIKVYGSGLFYQGKLYANATTSVTFDAKDPTGAAITTDVAASAGTLTDNGSGSYTLTMASADASITADFSSNPFAVTLVADGDNSSTLSLYDGCLANVTLSGTTLYKDGKVQTICLPFSLASFTGTPLEGFTVQIPTSGEVVMEGTEETDVYVIECSEVTAIEAHKPYIIKWGNTENAEGTEGTELENPVFSGVTIASGSPEEVKVGDDISLRGTYAVKSITDGGKDYYVKTDGTVVNTLACSLPAQQVFVYNNRPGVITQMRLVGAVPLTPIWSGNGTEDDPYLIQTYVDFSALASMVNEGQKYSGKYFKLTNDISVSTMVGGQTGPGFSGTFDGNGKTITVSYTNVTEERTAPFRYLIGATIKNLHVDGTIETSAKYAGGIAAYVRGKTKIENCHSSVIIRSSHAGFSGHGGIAALKANYSNARPTIEGCVFDGKILTTNESTFCSGIVGYTNGQSLAIKNCLVMPAALADGETCADGSTLYNNSTDGQPTTSVVVTDCYYTEVLGTDEQGTKAYTVESGTDGLTLDYGMASPAYGYSGIEVYDSGLLYGDKLYCGEGQRVNFIAKTAVEGYETVNMRASKGKLTANADDSYTLVMIADNSTVTAVLDDMSNSVILYDNPVGKTNAQTIEEKNDIQVNTILKGRTLYKDGSWNTLCLPFDMYTADIKEADHPLHGAILMVMDIDGYYDNSGNRYFKNGENYVKYGDASVTVPVASAPGFHQTGFDAETGTLYLFFQQQDYLWERYPAIVKWDGDGSGNITNPEFPSRHARIKNNEPKVITSNDGKVSFTGCYDPVTLAANDKTKLYLGTGNNLYYPSGAMSINAFRAYFQLNDGLTAGDVNNSNVRMFFGNDSEQTGIENVQCSMFNVQSNNAWHSLDGRKLSGKPTAKGIYIYNGVKRIIK